MRQLKFSASPSGISDYEDSEITFFFDRIMKAEPDTKPLTCYSNSGNAVHFSNEEYVHKGFDEETGLKKFNETWTELDISNDPGIYITSQRRHHYVDKEVYKQAYYNSIELINTKYEIVHVEMNFEEVLVDRPQIHVKINCFADVIAILLKDVKVTETKEVIKSGTKVIMDYKTNSKISAKDEVKFKNQARFYAGEYYQKTGEIINIAIFECVKIKQNRVYKFTDEEVINHRQNVIIPFVCEVIKKGWDISKYSIGNYKTPFNCHKKKIWKEEKRREQSNNSKVVIKATRKNNKLHFPSGLPDDLRKLVDNYFSYEIPEEDKLWIPSIQDHRWNGIMKFLKKNTLPYPFINRLNDLIAKFNDLGRNNYILEVEDLRDKSVVESKFDTKFKDSEIVLRDYQEEGVNVAIKKEISILNLSTSAGKTVMGAEIIKKLNCRSLFVVNRIELCRQNRQELESYLGVKVGLIAEGKFETDKQITVSTIQTVLAVLKRKNKDSQEMKTYLYNVNNVILDEVHGASNSKLYGSMANELVNVSHIVGLTATAMRLQNQTMEMNSLSGFVEYKKDMKELQDLGYLTPTKVFFFNQINPNEMESGEYHVDYENYIVKNKSRNSKVFEIIKKFRDKKKILVVCKSIEHGQLLSEEIENSYFLNGSSKKKERKEKFQQFKDTNEIVLIAMSQIVKQGISIKSLDIIINVSGHNSPIDTIQLIGRAKRQYTGKEFGIYIDFFDLDRFLPMATNRVKTLEENGETVEIIDSVDELIII